MGIYGLNSYSTPVCVRNSLTKSLKKFIQEEYHRYYFNLKYNKGMQIYTFLMLKNKTKLGLQDEI